MKKKTLITSIILLVTLVTLVCTMPFFIKSTKADVLSTSLILTYDTTVEVGKETENDKAISIDNTNAQNPVIGFNLSTAQDNAVDAAFAGGSASNGNILQVKNDGLYLDSTWDCGVY